MSVFHSRSLHGHKTEDTAAPHLVVVLHTIGVVEEVGCQEDEVDCSGEAFSAEGYSRGEASLRLCTLGAQSPHDDEGGLPKRSREGAMRKGNRTLGEIVCFKLYKSQIPVIEQAIESGSHARQRQIAWLLPGDDLRGFFSRSQSRWRGSKYALVLNGAVFFQFLPGEQRQTFAQEVAVEVANA